MRHVLKIILVGLSLSSLFGLMVAQQRVLLEPQSQHVKGRIGPQIRIEKSTNGRDADQAPGPIIHIGEKVTWIYEVTNIGEELLTNVIVTDDDLGQICSLGNIAPQESRICRAEGVARAGQYRNLATVTAIPGRIVSDPSGVPINSVSDSDPSHYIGEEAPTPPASLGDTVWDDRNRNGIQEQGERGISGVIVDLLDSTGHVLRSTVTDPNGRYIFRTLPTKAQYAIRVEVPEGHAISPRNAADEHVDSDVDPSTRTSELISLEPNEHDSSWDAGLYFNAPINARVGDRVWEDSNQNGVQDAGERGIASVVVKLINNAGAQVALVVSNNSGTYRFDDIPPGSYSVQFDVPTGYQVSPPNQGNQNNDSNINASGRSNVFNLSPNEEDLSIDAGLYRPAKTPQPPTACLGDRMWQDGNQNGVQDTGEQGFANLSVYLYDQNSNLLNSTQSTSDGSYRFCNLSAGSYFVAVAPPSGYLLSPPNQSDDQRDSDFNPSTGQTDLIRLNPGDDRHDIDGGLYLASPVSPQGACLGDYVWHDSNQNGIQDTGEQGITGITLTLYDSQGRPVASAKSDSNGNYRFCDLSTGDYFVRAGIPTGYRVTTPNAGADHIDSDFDGLGSSNILRVTSGQNHFDLDLGIYPEVVAVPNPPSVPESNPAPRPKNICMGGRVWNDSNHNGVEDSSESGVPSVTVRLIDQQGRNVRTTTTTATGRYLFCDLSEGDYAVEISLPSNARFTVPNATEDSSDSDANPSTGRTNFYRLTPSRSEYDADIGLIVLPPPTPRSVPTPAPTPTPTPAPQPCVSNIYDSSNSRDGAYSVWLELDHQANLYFQAQSIRFTEHHNNTAQLNGRVVDRSNPNRGLDVNVVFHGKTTTAPESSPKVYKHFIDPDPYTHTWTYYTSFSGSITGWGELAGLNIEVSRHGPAFQIGSGANLNDLQYGAASWFTAQVASRSPTNLPISGIGDFNFGLTPCR